MCVAFNENEKALGIALELADMMWPWKESCVASLSVELFLHHVLDSLV